MIGKSTLALPALLLACLVLHPPAVAPAAREAPALELTPLVVLSGTDGHVRDREYHRILDARSWAELWRRNRGVPPGSWQHHAHDRWVVGVPQIDFERCMVVAVFKGAGTHRGVGVERITEEPGALRFRFLAAWQCDPMFPQPPPRSVPPPEPREDPVPYDFFVLPRRDLPLLVEELVRDEKTGEYRPEERARFD